MHARQSSGTCSNLCPRRAPSPGWQLRRSPGSGMARAAAVEKQKLVYVLNRDAAANLTISSPLEAHKSHNIVFSVTGMDMGFDNPVFAAIELDYAEADQVCCNLLCEGSMSAAARRCASRGTRHGKHSLWDVNLPEQLAYRTACACLRLSCPLGLAQDPTGELMSEAQKHLMLYELNLGLGTKSKPNTGLDSV